MPHRYRYRVWLQDRDDAAWMIQSGYRRYLARLAPLHRAASFIQMYIRFKVLLARRKNRLTALHRWWRNKAAYVKFKKMMKFKRAISEQLVSGEFMYRSSVYGLAVNETWKGICERIYVGDSNDELHRFFVLYSTQGMVRVGFVKQPLTRFH